jgi:hypothetical protein
MRLSLACTIVALIVFTGDAFAPSFTSRLSRPASVLSSSVATRQAPAEIEEPADDDKKKVVGGIVPLTGEEINARRDAQLQKLRMKDKTSIQLEKQVCLDLLSRAILFQTLAILFSTGFARNFEESDCVCLHLLSREGASILFQTLDILFSTGFARNFEESDCLIICFIVFFRN